MKFINVSFTITTSYFFYSKSSVHYCFIKRNMFFLIYRKIRSSLDLRSIKRLKRGIILSNFQTFDRLMLLNKVLWLKFPLCSSPSPCSIIKHSKLLLAKKKVDKWEYAIQLNEYYNILISFYFQLNKKRNTEKKSQLLFRKILKLIFYSEKVFHVC